jgi:hypothetical protein
MAHYAFLDENNIVTEVIVGIDEFELIEGQDPEIWYGNFRGQTCKRTSYNTSAGQHILGGTAYRKNYAGIGFTYDENRDAFIPPKPYPSWILNEASCLWDSPIPYPNTNNIPEHYRNYNAYIWNEDILNWELVSYFDSWVLSEDDYYEAPIPHPTDGGVYEWDDLNNIWVNTQTNID